MNISLISTDEVITVYKKLGNSIAIAESSKINMTQRPDGSKGKIYYFNRIKVPLECRNNGVGTGLLKTLLKECKEKDVALLCEINPYGDMTEHQLKEWYIKYGFIEYLGVLWFI